jgi:hypothetical protein
MVPFDAEATMAVSPFEVHEYEPESYDGVAVAEEEDPFGAMATVEHAPDHANDPFGESAAAIHDPGAERADLQSLLTSASAVVQALEAALDRAKKHESELRKKLG